MASRGEGINHFNGVRLRVLGEGELQLKFLSMPDINGVQLEQDLIPLDMDSIIKGREPFKKVNFKQQRAQVMFYTRDINEYLKINRMVIFSKQIYANYPG